MDDRHLRNAICRAWILAVGCGLPALALAQASPFETGATSTLNFVLTIATPIAAILVIALGVAAAAGKISWGWVVGALVGIAVIFGAPQIVTWIRGMFGV